MLQHVHYTHNKCSSSNNYFTKLSITITISFVLVFYSFANQLNMLIRFKLLCIYSIIFCKINTFHMVIRLSVSPAVITITDTPFLFSNYTLVYIVRGFKTSYYWSSWLTPARSKVMVNMLPQWKLKWLISQNKFTALLILFHFSSYSYLIHHPSYYSINPKTSA